MSVFNKYERREQRANQMSRALYGEGLYIYQNNTNGDMMLPKPTASGVTKVPAGGMFQGDNYFMQLVKTNQCKLVQELVSPEQERKMKEDKETKLLNESKLILDQPQTVKASGPVEFVQPDKKGPAKPVTEDQDKKESPPQLLVEEPVDGVDILTD